MSRLRDLYQTTVSAELPDGTVVSFARMNLPMWTDLAAQIGESALAVELKAIPAQTRDPILQQTLRMRAHQFEPSFYDLLDSAMTPAGIGRILPFAAIRAGTDKELADQLGELLTPSQITTLINQIAHAPIGPKIGGDLSEGQSRNPTSAGSSSPATDAGVPTLGDENPPTSTGSESTPGSAP